MMLNIAIIGSGLTGLTVARNLNSIAKVSVFEKSRGVGGRLATRYSESYEFDHGAQYFIAKTDMFQQFVKELLDAGVILPWNARFALFDGKRQMETYLWTDDFPHYIGVPRMNAIGKYLAKDLNVLLSTKIVSTEFKDNKWWLHDDKEHIHGPYDWVISTAPFPQTQELFNELIKFPRIKMQGCFTLMLGFKKDLNLNWDVALIKNSCLSFLTVNSQKSNRLNTGTSLVALSDNTWSDKHIDDNIQDVSSCMLKELKNYISIEPDYQDIHRWRYANVGQQNPNQIIFDSGMRFIAGGDWSISGRVESAYLAGIEIVKHLESYIKD